MALATYEQLKATVRRWSKRKDAIDAFIDDFILLAEQEIYSPADRGGVKATPLRIKEMDTRSTATVSITERFIELPDDFLEMRRLKINAQTDTVPGFSEDRDIKYRAPDQLLLSESSGAPGFFTVTSQLGFERIPDQVYSLEMQYYKKETALSSANTTNAVLTKYPGIYLNGALSALWDHFDEPVESDRYHSIMTGMIKGANRGENKSRYGNAPQIKKERRGP